MCSEVSELKVALEDLELLKYYIEEKDFENALRVVRIYLGEDKELEGKE